MGVIWFGNGEGFEDKTHEERVIGYNAAYEMDWRHKQEYQDRIMEPATRNLELGRQ